MSATMPVNFEDICVTALKMTEEGIKTYPTAYEMARERKPH